MTIIQYTFCYNEMPILPFVVKYWQKFASFVVVYDNQSTDGSQTFLKQFPFVEVREYDTRNQLDDLKLQQLKNNCWKEARDFADWIVVSDMDECIWANNIKEVLASFKSQDVAVITPYMCNLISRSMPEQNETKLVHQQVDSFYDDFWPVDDGPGKGLKQKALIFQPNLVQEMNYNVGCYESAPKLLDVESRMITTDEILCMHLHDVGLQRKLERYSQRAARMSKANIHFHLSDFYLEDPHETTTDFMNDLRRSKSLKRTFGLSND